MVRGIPVDGRSVQTDGRAVTYGSAIPDSNLTQFNSSGSISNITDNSFDFNTDMNDANTRLYKNSDFPENNHKIVYDINISNWEQFGTIGLALWSNTADVAVNNSGYVAGCMIGDNSNAISNGIEVFTINGTNNHAQNSPIFRLSTNTTYTIESRFDVNNDNLTVEVFDSNGNSKGSDTTSINTSGLSTIYALQSTGDNINNPGTFEASVTNFDIT